MQEVVKDKLEDRLDQIEPHLRDLPDQTLARLPKSVYADVPLGLGLNQVWTPVLSESSTVIELPESDAEARDDVAVLDTLESRSHGISLSASVRGPEACIGGDQIAKKLNLA